VAYDPVAGARDDAAAAQRFPGPNYLQVLGWIHQELRPASYVEIGVLHGHSMKLARPGTVAIGIDPHPRVQGRRVFPLTSTEFFRRFDLRQVLGMPHFSLALIDGLHLYEQVLEDFINLERYAGPDSVILLHDTVPLSAATSGRERTTRFYTGDVWKVVPLLRRWRPDLRIGTVRTAPSGLTLVSNLNWRAGRNGCDALVREYASLGWLHHGQVRPALPNDRAAVVDWLRSRSSAFSLYRAENSKYY
jgi:hypothetical protein